MLKSKLYPCLFVKLEVLKSIRETAGTGGVGKASLCLRKAEESHTLTPLVLSPFPRPRENDLMLKVADLPFLSGPWEG